MSTRIRFRSVSKRNLRVQAVIALVSLLIGMALLLPRSLSARGPFRGFRSPSKPAAPADEDDDDDDDDDEDEPVRPVAKRPVQPGAKTPVKSTPDFDTETDEKVQSAKPTRPAVAKGPTKAGIKKPVKQTRVVDPFDDDKDTKPARPGVAKRPTSSGAKTPVNQARRVAPDDDDDDFDEDVQPARPIAAKRTDGAQKSVRQAQFVRPGDDDDDDDEMNGPLNIAPMVVGNGYGSINRASHLAGKTFGRNDSITPVEFMPYILTDEHFIFTDLRGFVSNRSQLGGNLGIGYRRLFDDWNAWGGASLWYDADHSTGKLFQQVGLSFEGLIQNFEVRSNVYLPFTSSQTLANTIGNTSIVGNQLLFGRSSASGAALSGADAEVGYSWPIMDRHVVRAFVGGYHFDGGSTGGVNGFKARVEGVINNTVTAQVLYTHDKLYGDNAMVGVSFQFPFAKDHPTSGWKRNTPSPFRFVERNYNVIVATSQSSTAPDQVATDPTTGKAYVVEQVYAPVTPIGPSGTPDGTTAHPFSTVAAAQAAGGDVIIVQRGSVLNQAITLTSGQHLFGQSGAVESLATLGGGNVQIPNLLQAAQSNSAAPIIQNVAGTALTLASNTEVAGFTIAGSTGNGITGNSVSGVSLHDLVFSSIGGDAINLTNSSGHVAMSNIQVNSANGNGIVFNGGNANISFLGGGDTIAAQGNGFTLQNLTGGAVNLSGLTVSNVGGTGLIMNHVATDVTVNSLTVAKSGTSTPGNPGSAVAISGDTGTTQTVNGVPTNVFNTYNFTGNTKITSPSGSGFAVNGSDAIINVGNLNVTSSASHPAVSVVNATSAVTLGTLTLNTQNGTGLFANSASNLQVAGGSITTVNAPALDVESSTFHGNLGLVSVNGGPFGIKLQNSTGSFAIQGNGSFGTGGTIQNTTTAGLVINSFTNTTINWVDFTKNAAAIQSTGSTQLVLSDLRVTGSTGYGFDSLNDGSVSLTNSIFSTNGAVGGGTVRIQASTAGSFVSVLRSNNITDNNGTAIQFLTQPGGAGAALNLQVTSNSLSGYGAGSSIVGVNWNGPVTSTVSSNTINAYGANMTGVSIQDPSLTSSLTSAIISNSVTFIKTGNVLPTSGTGIWIVDGQSGQSSTGKSTLTVTGNNIAFQGAGGTGMRYGFYGTTSTVISQNTIIDRAGGATGMLFDSVAANSDLAITGNTIELLVGDKTTNHGFVFTNFVPTVQLDTQSGAASNLVYSPSSPHNVFSGPATGVTGGILINGLLYQ